MSDKLGKALVKLAFDQPFFGTLLAMTPLLKNPAFPTLATDGRNILYNPAFIDKLTDPEALGVLLHELLHIVYLHCLASRRGSRTHLRWNAACDFAVNQEISSWGFSLPSPRLHDKKFNEMTAEQIYDLLPEETLFACLDQHLTSPEDSRGEIIGRILSAAQAAQGHIPEGISRHIKILAASRVPWTRILRRFLKESLAREDQSFLPPNRRHLWEERYLPSASRGLKGNLVIAIDTSGSISQSNLAAFAAELKALSDLCDDLTVLSCDAKVHQTVKLRELPAFLRKLHFKGGGNTSFIPVFDKIQADRLKPNALVYLTDGLGTFPKAHPKRYPVLWCLTQPSKVPWGKSILLPFSPFPFSDSLP